MPDAIPQPPTAETPPPPDLTGRTLGDYLILRRLGVGGMGQVYLSRQLSLKREVALKLLRDDLSTNSTALLRFQAEAEAVAKLNHPNIVHIHQLGEVNGQRYMVLEYVDGRNLRDHLARKGPPELAVSLSIMRQVALALQKAHEEGIVHRDIKPENILVTRKVEVKVADFGLSRFFAGAAPALNLTQSGVTLGTPLYMSPEQVQGLPIDNRSDVYSFGVTCYHLLTGDPPFRGATAFDVALKHVQEEPRPIAELRPDLPPDLCAMVHKMMEKSPDDRYQSAREVLRDLARVRDGVALGLARSGTPRALSLSGAGSPPQPAEAQPRLRARWLAGTVIGLAAFGVGVLLYAVLHSPKSSGLPAPVPALPGTGLPDIRSPEKLISSRERELVALLANRETTPNEVVSRSIELGLLYVREGRLDEADARFRKLENEQFPKEQVLTRTASLAGRLGQAVAAAYRDTPASAQLSIDLFMRTLTEAGPKFGGKDRGERSFQAVSALLLKHLELGQAVSEALNRNALALGKPRLDSNHLELLRHPPGPGKPQ